MPDDVTLSINGTDYAGWKGVTVTRSIDSVCGSFELNVSDRWPNQNIPRAIREGDECQVFLGNDVVITGFVDGVSPAITKDTHSLAVRGRDKTCDLVDCSAEIDLYELVDEDLAGIAGMVCEKFGIELKVQTGVGEPFVRFSIQPGDSAFSIIERAARQRGVSCTTDGNGALVLTARGEFKPAGDRLEEGVNLLAATADYDWTSRHQTYRVLGQMPSFHDGADDPMADMLGQARDANVMRYRPLILTCEIWTDAESAEKRAKCECAWRAGKSLRVNVQVMGWRQSNGMLWEPGYTVHLISPSLYQDDVELVISTVRYSISDSSGQIAELEMTRPDAYLDNGEGEVEKDPFND